MSPFDKGSGIQLCYLYGNLYKYMITISRRVFNILSLIQISNINSSLFFTPEIYYCCLPNFLGLHSANILKRISLAYHLRKYLYFNVFQSKSNFLQVFFKNYFLSFRFFFIGPFQKNHKSIFWRRLSKRREKNIQRWKKS